MLFFNTAYIRLLVEIFDFEFLSLEIVSMSRFLIDFSEGVAYCSDVTGLMISEVLR